MRTDKAAAPVDQAQPSKNTRPGAAEEHQTPPAGANPSPLDVADSWAARYRGGIAQLSSRQKPGYGVPAYMRWVNRKLARPMAAAAFASGMTPNQVTAVSAAMTVAGLAVAIWAPTTLWIGAPIAVLMALGFALDSADGQLARLRGGGGPAGEWVDHVVDAIRTPTIHIAVAVALYRAEYSGAILLIPLVFAVLASGQFFSQILAEQLDRTQPAVPSRAGGNKQSFALLPMDPGVLCWLFLLWGVPAAFLPLYAFLGLCLLAYAGVSMRRKYQRLTSIGK